MAAPVIYMEPLDGSEMIRVLKNGRLYFAPVTAVLDPRMGAALAALTARLDALEAALAAEGRARAAADTGLATRASALEARPEEVAHFTASAKLPTLAALATVTLTLTGLVPARVGDLVRKGEAVSVEPATALPAGISIAAVSVPADGTVAVQLLATLAIGAGTTPLSWLITALR